MEGPEEEFVGSVLIVDDSREYAAVLSRILTGVFEFSDVVWAEDPDDARAMLDEYKDRFRFFFVDYNFHGEQNGTEFLRELSDAGRLEEGFAFLITSEPTPDNMKEALSYGALGVIAKPFEREELGRQLEKAKRLWKTRRVESF
ncbi:MAG: response regulator [Bdellovibrionales bacterium]|nr:response regulator [Bdellovibrionales bacterium]